ncbi:MAG: hypothetical protein ACRCY4_10635 [Brevinema sp.]
MKNIISVLSVLMAINACSASPGADANNTPAAPVNPEIALQGAWVATDDPAFEVISFSGNSATEGAKQFTLANPSSIVLGGSTYAVYSSANGLDAFRADGDRLIHGGSSAANIATLRANFDNPAQGFAPSGDHVANRKK